MSRSMEPIEPLHCAVMKVVEALGDVPVTSVLSLTINNYKVSAVVLTDQVNPRTGRRRTRAIHRDYFRSTAT